MADNRSHGDLTERIASRALCVARRFLARWTDAHTRNASDDIAQETALAVMERWSTVRDPARFDAFVRTIARRKRSRSLHVADRGETLASDLREAPFDVAVDAGEAPMGFCRVGPAWVERQRVLELLDELLPRLSQDNGRLLRAFYEGASCAELARRFELSPGVVKVRLYRSRRRLRADCEVHPAVLSA
jgi:RNA polymerase sigma factor (sigma-70 family)